MLKSNQNRYIELSQTLQASPDGPVDFFQVSSARQYCFQAQVRRRNSLVNKDLTEEKNMDLLWTLAVILLVLWLLGLVTSYTLGGFIHILLVVALIVVLIRVIQGRRPV